MAAPVARKGLLEVTKEAFTYTRKLAQDFHSAKDLESKRDVSKNIFHDYLLRSAVEDRYLVPEFQRVTSGDLASFNAFNEVKKNNIKLSQLFAQAERLMVNRQRLEEEAASFEKVMGEALSLTEKHVSHQTASILPKLQSDLSEARSFDLASDVHQFHGIFNDQYLREKKKGLFVGNEYFVELNHNAKKAAADAENSKVEAEEREAAQKHKSAKN